LYIGFDGALLNTPQILHMKKQIIIFKYALLLPIPGNSPKYFYCCNRWNMEVLSNHDWRM